MMTKNQDNWTEVITTKNKLSIFPLKELLKFRDLILLFVRRDFVALYKQTVLGPFWYLLQPLLQTLIFSLMFGNIFSISDETGVPSILFYLSGNVTWIYFSQSLVKTSNTFTANAHIFGKVYFPRMVVPVSILLSNLIGFAIQFLLFVGFYLFYVGRGLTSFNMQWEAVLLIPILILNMMILGMGIGLVISSLTTKYKDFKQFIGFGVQLLMYMSPVIVPMSIVKERFPSWSTPLLEYNPMTPIIEGFRYTFFSSYDYQLSSLIYSFAIGGIFLLYGSYLFNKTEQNFMDTV